MVSEVAHSLGLSVPSHLKGLQQATTVLRLLALAFHFHPRPGALVVKVLLSWPLAP